MSPLNTILIVEDDKLFRHMIKDALEDQNFLILESSHGQRSLEILKDYNVDAILLDLNLPDGYGLNFIKPIREQTQAPLIIISGEDDEKKKILGFEYGADDFVSKPISPPLLSARIKAHIRKSDAILTAEKSADADHNNTEHIKFGSWFIDRLQFQLMDENGHSAELTIREFNVLDFLISNAGRAVKREELCEAIKEHNYVPTPRAMDVKITRIRKKIGDHAMNPKLLLTVRGVGYCVQNETLKYIE